VLRWLSSLALIGLFSAPALATGSETAADCMLARISHEDRIRLGEYALGGEAIPAGLNARLESHAHACGDHRSLSGEQLEQAGVNLLARLVLERIRARLEVAGIPAEALDGWFDAQTEQVRGNYGAAGMNDAEVETLTESMIAAFESRGIAAARVREHSGLVGSYLNTRTLRFRMQHGLPLR
jgi:hypothetical protein